MAQGIASEANESRPPLQTVDRALSVLLSYDQHRTVWSVQDLAHEFKLDKSTAQRLLATLARRGFLHADDVTRRYQLGPAVWRMATIWQQVGGMSSLVEPALTELAHDTGRTAVVALPDGAHVRCISAVNGDAAPIRDHPLVGELYPAHAGATPRGYFAFLRPTDRRELLYNRPIARFTNFTTVEEAALEEIMVQTQADGWAFSKGEYDANTQAIAVPVMLLGRPMASVSIAEIDTDQEDDIRDHVERLQQTAMDISLLFSNRPSPSPLRGWRKAKQAPPARSIIKDTTTPAPKETVERNR